MAILSDLQSGVRWFVRKIRLIYHVLKVFLNPCHHLFLHRLGYQLLYLITHEEKAARILYAASRETVSTRGVQTEYSFAEKSVTMKSPDVADADLELLTDDSPGSKASK